MRITKKTIFGTAAVVATAACGGAGVRAYETWKEANRVGLIHEARDAVAQGADGVPDPAGITAALLHSGDKPGVERDDPELRQLMALLDIGNRSSDDTQQILQIAQSEAAKWGAPTTNPQASSPGTRAWRSLGPAAARSEWNGVYFPASDTGRLTQIRVDPTAPATVYVATSGGGVWKTTNFGSAPTWAPITEALGSLAIGAMDVDPNNPQTLYLGLGDAFDQKAGVVVKSTDGGATWGAPVALKAPSHPADGLPSAATNVRDLRVDPSNSQLILAASDDALYRSVDGGSTFTLVDLPNAGAATLRESTWSLAYLGGTSPSSAWLVSGVYACPGANPPQAGFGVGSCTANPASANFGDIWRSTDSGATWASARVSGTLPVSLTGSAATDIGRIALGGGPPNGGNSTIAYAEAGTMTESSAGFTPYTAAILKSSDSGATWSKVADPSTQPVNPTTSNDCTTMDLGHTQSWYNLAVAVDPGDPNRAIFGGNLCAARTVDGGATWSLVSNWLPLSGLGVTSQGFLPYVHADWHAALVVRAGGQISIFAGTDGGFFVSHDAFDAPQGELATWSQPDVGLATDLHYAHGSGDPVFGDGDTVFSGLQDNGTRFRLIQNEAFIYAYNTLNWDQVIGGDGIGAAVAHDSRGLSSIYWASVPQLRLFCHPRNADCSKATRIVNGVEVQNWNAVDTSSTLPSTDGEPFFMRYSPVNDGSSSVISASAFNLWKVSADANDVPSLTQLTPNGITLGGHPRQIRGLGPYASPWTYSIPGSASPARVYGMPLTGGWTALLVDQDGAYTLAPAQTRAGTATEFISTYSIAIPADPTHLGGTDIRNTWVVSSASTTTQAGNSTFGIGFVFKTIDGGATWTPFHGNGTGFDLPNVPVFVIRFDPSEPSDQTIWAGTELGLYRSTDGGATWARYGQGLPMVRVSDITLSSNGALVRASTYGRGVWEIHPHAEQATGAGTGDWNNDGVIDFFDLAPLASRMGTTPVSNASPADYDSNLDLVPGTSPSIDDADLAALVAKFGSNP